MTPDSRIPLHVVTGFLGAGKTTLVNRLLRAPDLAETLVIVNEWGEVGLDHLLYETLADDAILISSGCICCALRGDLIDGLHDVLSRRDEGALAPFSRIVLETTGLADPAPILHALLADGVLTRRIRLAGVTTLIDAVNGLATLEAHGEARRQAALADRLVLSKADLATPGALAPLRAALESANPGARIFEGSAFAASDFLGETLDFEARPRPTRMSAHDASIISRVYTAPQPIDGAALGRFLAMLGEMLGPRLLRVKGLVAVREHPDQPVLIQGAQHIFAPPRRLAAWPDANRTTRIVVIADGLAPNALDRLGRALSGTPEIDMPDLAALSENPLAPRRGGLLG